MFCQVWNFHLFLSKLFHIERSFDVLVNNNLFLFCPGRGCLFIIFSSSLSLFNSNSLVINSSSFRFHVVSSYENFLLMAQSEQSSSISIIFSYNFIILERFDIFTVNIHHILYTEYNRSAHETLCDAFSSSLYSLLLLLLVLITTSNTVVRFWDILFFLLLCIHIQE